MTAIRRNIIRLNDVGYKNTYMSRNFWVTYGYQLYFASPKIKAPNYMKNYDAYAI